MTTTLIRLTDSGFVLQSAGITVAFDVGEYCDKALLDGLPLDAAVFTHSHGDHCDTSKLPNKSITMVAPADMREALTGCAAEFLTLSPGTSVSTHGFSIASFAVDHGTISRPIDNYGLVITTPTGERIWFTGDIRVDSQDRPSGRFDLVVVPIGGEYVFDATEAFAYLLQFEGEFAALGVHYDYAPEQADIFTSIISDRVAPIVLAPGSKFYIGVD